jgi:excisionase family DNA binding protein
MPREQLLTVPEVAACLNTGERFVRRLIAERRIAFVRLGRKVRVPASAVDSFVAAGRVDAVGRPRAGRAA